MFKIDNSINDQCPLTKEDVFRGIEAGVVKHYAGSYYMVHKKAAYRFDFILGDVRIIDIIENVDTSPVLEMDFNIQINKIIDEFSKKRVLNMDRADNPGIREDDTDDRDWETRFL